MSETKYVVNLSLVEKIYLEQLEKRKIILSDEIDEMLVEDFIMHILKWNEEDEGIPVEERKPITVYLNSPGGDVFLGLVIAEIIKKSSTPVHIIALGIAASMGAIILVSGGRRLAYKHTNILLHDGSLFINSSSNKAKDTMKFYDEKNEQIKQFILENTSITEELYDSMEDREWWMSAETAMSYNIIDEIIS